MRKLFLEIAVVLALSIALPSFALAQASVEKLILVDGKTEPCPIVLFPKTFGHERQAAVLLAKYLSQISGREFKMLESEKIPEGRAILVGKVAGTLPAGISGDSFSITADSQKLKLQGGTPMGTAFAAMCFLEENLGCKFWSWDEEDIPSKPEIIVGPINRMQKAVFKQGDIWNWEAQTNQNGFMYKSRGIPTIAFTGNHTIHPLLASWLKDHPEAWSFSEKDGKRVPNNVHLCYMAPGMPEALAEALSKVVDRNKGNVKDFIYFAGMGDWWGGMCQCEVCKKIYEEEKWTRPNAEGAEGKTVIPCSSTLLRMINRTAEILEQKYPGIQVGTMAYLNLEAPPGLTKPRSNVIIQVPHLRHCLAHPVDFPCNPNATYYDNLKRWCELAPGRVCVWDYNVNFGGNFIYPFPTLGAMAENLRVYSRLGCFGVAVQGNYVSMGSDLVVAKNYVLCKVLWNPELKTEDLLSEFCKGYYGPAAEDMLSYIKLLENLAGGKGSRDFMEYEDLPLNALKPKCPYAWLGPERIAEYQSKFDAMLKKCAGQEPWTRRIKEARASIDAAEMWGKQVLLVEKDNRLVRSDRPDTYDRFKEFIKYTRNSSSCEFGNYLAYQQDALSQQGGPLHILSNQDLKVKVSPTIAARIYQMLYRGKPLLWVPNFANLKYPYYGGCFSRVYSGATTGGVRNAEIVGTPTPTKVVMEGDAGIGLWNVVTQQIHTRTIEILSEDSIRITGTARRVNKISASAICSEVTQYQGRIGEKDPLVEALLENGQWQKIQFKENDKGKPSTDDDAEDLPAASDKVSPVGLWRPPAKPKDLVRESAIPKGSTTFRIHLPDSSCIVEDKYLAPAAKGGTAIYNETTGVITMIVNLAEVPVPEKGEGTWMVREMKFSPIDDKVKK